MIRRYNGSSFVDVNTLKRCTGNTYTDIATAKRWDGKQWVDILAVPTQQYVKTYALSQSQKYWNNGSQDNQSITASVLIQGTWSGSSNIRRSLMWFDIGDDLIGAQIRKVELYLYRQNDSHGSTTANINIKTHNYSEIPSKWTGTDTGAADGGTPTLKRGVGAWFTLNNNVGEKLRDGAIKGLALDSDSNTSISNYLRCVRTGTYAPKLRITYTK